MILKLNYIFLQIIILFSLSNNGLADSKKIVPFLFHFDAKKQDTKLDIDHGALLYLNKNYSELIFSTSPDSLIIENFPINHNQLENVTLYLSSSPFESYTTFSIANTQLEEYFFNTNDFKVYKGKISSIPSADITMTYYSGVIYAIIEYPSGETYSIFPDRQENDINFKHYLIDGNILDKNNLPWLCLTDDVTHNSTYNEDIKHLAANQLNSSNILEVKIAAEATSEFFNFFLSTDKAIAYISSVIAHISKIYEENINTRFIISHILIWQNSQLDPYINENLLSDKLSIMPELWKQKTVDRAITVLFASLAAQQGGVNVAGIAFGGQPGKGNLCNLNYGYCVLGIRGGVNFPTTNYAWDINVAAHEIGHLFGSPHTHACYWNPPIDTCVTRNANGVGDACIRDGNPIPRPGTIMSYCHLTNSSHSVQLHFHQKEKPLMRKAAENAKCINAIIKPYISLLSPLGDRTYKSGDIIEIRWTSANISKVHLRYSTDNGKQWLKIADYINVKDSIYYWKLPKIVSNEVIVLIHSSTDITINDMSFLTFSIFEPSISILSPKQDDHFPVSSEITIEWKSVFIDSLVLDFSDNGGNSWNRIARLEQSNSYKWILPDKPSDLCKIRLTSIDGNKIIAESGLFKIGKPYAKITLPLDKEELCIGETYYIKWTSEYITVCFLDYSTNGGDTWRKITLTPLNPNQGEFAWKVPDKPSENVKIRISTKINDEIVILDEPNIAFTIKNCFLGIADEHLLTDSNVLPNPAENHITVYFTQNHDDLLLDFSIYSIDGKLILHQTNVGIENGRLFIKTNTLDNGTYLLLINQNGSIKFHIFKISK